MTEINFLNIIQVLVAIALIGFILIQRGPGATAGSAFGGGASGTVFGAKGSGSFLSKSTAILATLFFIITMLIAIDASDGFSSGNSTGEQDLGVFGALEDVDAEPSITPIDGTDVNVDEVINEAIDTVDDDVNETIEAVEQSSAETLNAADQAVDDVVEETEQAADSDDTDGGNN